MADAVFNLWNPTLAADPAPWRFVAGTGVVALVLLAILQGAGLLKSATLRRGPLREVDFSAADVVIGLGFVGMIFLDKLLVDVGGRWVVWPVNIEKGIRTVSGMAIIAAAVFFFAKAWLTDAGLRKAGLVPRRPGRDLVFGLLGTPVGILLTFATLILVNAAATAAGVSSPEVNHSMLTQLQTANPQQRMSLIVAAVAIGPLLEEIVFRGLLQTLLLEVFGRRQRWLVIVTAAAMFAVVHLGATSWHALPGLFVLGVVLGWLYERTGSLLPCVLVHAGFNALNIAWVLNAGEV